MQSILVTGGAGFIGSHTVVELVEAGFQPIILDNFSNADHAVIDRLSDLTGQQIDYYEGDFQDAALLGKVFAEHKIAGVIHFAAFKAVGESVAEPLKYYDNNVAHFVHFLQAITKQSIPKFIFSSSAAVYGNPPTDQVTEETACAPESPYGWTKYMNEIVLRDTCAATPTLHGTALRYFNVVGGHSSAKIGESPKGKPQNLLPIIVQAVANKKPFTVYGSDYDTPDGTCMRDYIHVVDLAKAHVAALQDSKGTKNYRVYNIGTGQPTSVLELISSFEKQNNVKVPYKLGERRAGDPAAYYAVAEKANRELGWQATKTIDDAVREAWRWQQSTSRNA